jgi:hypothetical protein
MTDLKQATDALAKETHSGVLSNSYHDLRERWVTLFAPMHTVLHNFDPMFLAKVQVYAPRLAELLTVEMTVNLDSLNRALEAEQNELSYSDESFICTLCLQIVRNWSDAQTIAGGLTELSVVLGETITAIDKFLTVTWPAKEAFGAHS